MTPIDWKLQGDQKAESRSGRQSPLADDTY